MLCLYDKCMEIAKIEYDKNNDSTIQTYATQTDIKEHSLLETNYQNNKMSWICNHIYYISDIHLVHKIINKFKKKVTDQQITKYIAQIAKNLLKKEIRENLTPCSSMIFFGGDISSDFEIAKIFYTEFMNYYKKRVKKSHKCEVYAILGNHEFWDFDNVDDCYSKYGALFDSLGIRFLNNNIIRFLDTLIVGGVGFSGHNPIFNAESGLYRQALSKYDDILETQKWEEIYNKALNYAKNENRILIVLSHNPPNDWKSNGIKDENCVYFHGHDHRNAISYNSGKNVYVFADNQIGYNNQQMQFKLANICRKTNPFATYVDGVHEIKTNDYLDFYSFSREHISGNGHIENQLKSPDAHFYMIKRSGFYGFFLTTKNGTYIAVGGRIKKINVNNDIKQIDSDFLNVVNGFIEFLNPYRKAQERIANAVSEFGGSGQIHGCIIDIDFYNHIMLNPIDSSITYYYSPMFGCAEKHDNLLSLLESHNQALAKQYQKRIKSKSADNSNQLIENNEIELIEIDIKNSLYVVSGKINQLQRLFDSKILRDWDDSFLINKTCIKENKEGLQLCKWE